MIKWIVIAVIGLFIYGGGLSSFNITTTPEGKTNIVIDQEKAKQSVINGYQTAGQGIDMSKNLIQNTNVEVK